MRKFNFDIDDWTGGNTLGKSMGDTIGSTVKEMLFSIITKNVKEFSFYNNAIVPLIVDWGDGDKQTITRVGKTSHVYKDYKMSKRMITFYNQEDELKISKDKIKTSLISMATDIDSYIIEHNKYNSVYRYVEVKPVNKVKNLIFRHGGLKTLEAYAFEKLNILSSVIIPNGVTDIKANCFARCTIQGDLIMPDSINSIGLTAFSSLRIHNDLILPKTLTEIGPHLFLGLQLNKDLIIPDSVKTIGFNAFGDLNTCTNIHFGKGLKSIEGYAFTFATDLNGPLKLNDGLEYIGKYAFSSDCNLTGELVIPSSVKKIDECAFTSCVSLQGIVLNEGLEKIGSRAFKGCNKLSTDIVIPESVKEIDYMAFDVSLDNIITIYICKDTKCSKLISEKGMYNVNITFYEKGDKLKL